MHKLKKIKWQGCVGGEIGGMYSKGQGKASVTLIPQLKRLLYMMGREGG